MNAGAQSRATLPEHPASPNMANAAYDECNDYVEAPVVLAAACLASTSNAEEHLQESDAGTPVVRAGGDQERQVSPEVSKKLASATGP